MNSVFRLYVCWHYSNGIIFLLNKNILNVRAGDDLIVFIIKMLLQ